jgi:signal transduction histidine kinase
MYRGAGRFLRRLSLTQQFLLGSLVVLLIGMVGIGAWVARQIESQVVHRTAATTALYVDSLITPSLQELATAERLPAQDTKRLDWLIRETPLGKQVALFRVWDRDGRIVYSTIPSLLGQRFPVEGHLATALNGQVAADVGDLEGELDTQDGASPDRLLEIYSPVRRRGTDEVIAAAEFYYGPEAMLGDVAAAQRRSWLVVAAATVVIYGLLGLFIRRASNTIVGQRRQLGDQVERLTDLLHRNDDLDRRVRGAAARTTALNERFLRRFSAELHDGPAQDISLALLRLDHVYSTAAGGPDAPAADRETVQNLDLIQSSLRRALDELRATASGLMLPQLTELTLTDTIDHVARVHRRRTGATVDVSLRDLPTQAPLVTKIALYRIVQEALTNAWRHGGTTGPRLSVARSDGRLRVEIADQGPGFDVATIGQSEERLGLVGMRERVESLGGQFEVQSAPGAGTRVVATLPVQPVGVQYA